MVTQRFNKRQIEFSRAQRDIALDKLKFDLFELRYGIYLAAKDLIQYVSIHRELDKVDSNHVRSLYVKLDEARFFFDKETIKFMQEIVATAKRRFELKRQRDLADIDNEDVWSKLADELTGLEIQIARLVAAISDSDEPLPALLEALKARETERVGLEERLRQIKASNVVTLHPNVLKDYRANVEKLHEALVRHPDSQENRFAFRNMIDSIVVHPTGYREPYEVSVFGRLASIMGLDLFPTVRSNKEILAEEGVSSGDNGCRG